MPEKAWLEASGPAVWGKQEVPKEYLEQERRYDTFREALRGTLIGTRSGEITEADLSEYEKMLQERGVGLKMGSLVDIDGVLIDTESEIKKVMEIMTSNFDVIGNLNRSVAAAKNTKIPLGSLKNLLQCRDKCEHVVLLTDRCKNSLEYFPCFNEKSRDALEQHGVVTETGMFKFLPLLSNAEKFMTMLECEDIVYYFGSSGSDRSYVKKMRAEMQKRKIPQEKLVYVHIEGSDRHNIL